jgi:hypothetical protein
MHSIWKQATSCELIGRGILNHWNPNEVKRFFWVMMLSIKPNRKDSLTSGLDKIPEIRAATKGGNRIVFTSRDYIWNEAKRALRFGTIAGLGNDEEGTITIHLLSNHPGTGADPIQSHQLEIRARPGGNGWPQFCPMWRDIRDFSRRLPVGLANRIHPVGRPNTRGTNPLCSSSEGLRDRDNNQLPIAAQPPCAHIRVRRTPADPHSSGREVGYSQTLHGGNEAELRPIWSLCERASSCS